MIINYETKAAGVISMLEQAGYQKETIADHRRCYDAIQSCFESIGCRTPSMEIALEWLETRKPDWSYETYKKYRGALFRLEYFILYGNIICGKCRGLNDFACRSKLTHEDEVLLREFRAALSANHTKRKVEQYATDCAGFLVFLTEQGLTAPSEMSLGHILDYWQRVCTMQHIDSKKRRYVSATVKLLSFLADRGDIPRCYSNAYPGNAATKRLPSLKLLIAGTTFQPSKGLEPFAAEFLSSLNRQRYSDLVIRKNRHDLTGFFLFIEVNHLGFSPESIELWLEHSPKNAIWERRRHTLTLFADFLATGSINKESCYTWQTLKIDNLPDWSRDIILGFVNEQRREGLSRSTLKTGRLAGCRFFGFLDSKGVNSPQEITPEIVKEFHNTDKHSTPGSKNTYGIKIRQLLSYMAEQKLVPQNLFLAVSTQCAPCRSIVSVMSAEMEAAVYQYRTDAVTPIELRNAAMAMLGLRMGVRASDIVNLKIDDFDWIAQTVSFIQKKTSKAITIPVPVDVGNSVHKYIMDGRPESGSKGGGYVFIRHHAPYGGMDTIQACRYALKKIMSAYGLELPPGQGFHITRKTFATRLLSSNNTIDDISNALGHAMPETVEVYLARDEERMRLCPLPFESVGVV